MSLDFVKIYFYYYKHDDVFKNEVVSSLELDSEGTRR